ncbi:hypothetical protein [Paenibacillus flagellatus]|uniref:Uncharacterized protein n=1 Tax=Paenibacillus flagellatus TaxID=2211139 RepID=A0A2V5KRJ7_9BACL|nr:hypothetical protein [Paenibacillus flagellatus]PYI51486.1 hypothetical protein DLM86_23965 [Paenibacillus flagellatus]
MSRQSAPSAKQPKEASAGKSPERKEDASAIAESPPGLYAPSPATVGYLQRSIGNRAVGSLLRDRQAPGRPGARIQRNMLKYDEIPDPNTHHRWVPFRTGVGRGAAVDGSPTSPWTTAITWQNASRDEGTEMTANPLGPDHPLGSKPGTSGKWVDKRKAQEKRAGNKTDYVAGHLLNENLGGPGNDVRNLAAIPKAANTQHLEKAEDKIKSIVNDHHGWVYYKVWTDQLRDNAAQHKPYYTSAIHCEWHQLDPNTKTAVPGTDGKVDIDIPPPSYYKGGSTGLRNVPALSGAGVNRSDRDGAAAWTHVARKEVVLTNTDDLSSAAAVMKPIQAVLDKMGLSDYLLDVNDADLKKSLTSITKATALSTEEKDANDVIERELDVLKDLETKLQLADYGFPAELGQALQNAPQERKKRFETVMAETDKLYKLIYQASEAATLMNDVKEAWEQEEAPRVRVEQMCIQLINAALELKKQRDQSMSASIPHANASLGFHGLSSVDTSLSFTDQLKAVQQTEVVNPIEMDEVEEMWAPMSPYRTEMAEEQVVQELPDYVPRGNKTAQQSIRANQKKLNSSSFLKSMKKHGLAYSRMKPHEYDRRLIDLIRKRKNPEDFRGAIGGLVLQIGAEITVILLKYVEARSKQDEDAQEEAKELIRRSYPGNGRKYKIAYEELSRV